MCLPTSGEPCEIYPYPPLLYRKFWEKWCAILLISECALPRTDSAHSTLGCHSTSQATQPGNSLPAPFLGGTCRNFYSLSDSFWASLTSHYKAHPFFSSPNICCIDSGNLGKVYPRKSVVPTSSLTLDCGVFRAFFFNVMLFSYHPWTVQKFPVNIQLYKFL